MPTAHKAEVQMVARTATHLAVNGWKVRFGRCVVACASAACVPHKIVEACAQSPSLSESFAR
eukprot:3036345-Pleurochrysis_carterae.AAC.1